MSHAPPRERPRFRSLKCPVVHKLVAYTPARLPSPCFFDFSTQPGAVPPATKSQPLNTSQADRRTRTTHDCRPSLDYEGIKALSAVCCAVLGPCPRPLSPSLARLSRHAFLQLTVSVLAVPLPKFSGCRSLVRVRRIGVGVGGVGGWRGHVGHAYHVSGRAQQQRQRRRQRCRAEDGG